MSVVITNERVDLLKGEQAKATLSWRRSLENVWGARAALRRATSVDEALAVPAFHDLRHEVLGLYNQSGLQPVEALARAAIAGANLEWREPDGRKQQRRFGAGCAVTRGGHQIIKPERFQLLIGTEDPDLFLRLLRGVIAQLEGKLPLLDTMQTVFDWQWRASRVTARRTALLSFHDGEAMPDVMTSQTAEWA